MACLNDWKTSFAVGVLSLASAIVLPAQTLTTVHSFDGADGQYPQGAALVQATDGSLYGTVPSGGANGYGTVFKMTASGSTTVLYSFCSQAGCTDGDNPLGGLVQGADGNFYGTTELGGVYGYGTVFRITPAGKLTTLHSFDSTDGAHPFFGALVQATDGSFYGTTADGGTSDACTNGCGTIFKITPSGTLATLHSFDSTDGAGPLAALIQATDGNFYGTTDGDGASSACPYGCGTVFKITPGGKLTTLHSFDDLDGGYSFGALVQATDGNFYGTTSYGGSASWGTVFKITPAGNLTTLYNFCSQENCTDGGQPYSGLVQATDRNFYGTTAFFGASGFAGTLFKITPGGSFTSLYSFCSRLACGDGDEPIASLIQDTNGKFFGTNYSGGASDDGTVYSLSVGLGAFVETQTTSGKVGAAVNVLGTNLTGATSVTFNGTAAVFKVASSSLITTTVPKGATTGKIHVTTPHGTLTSNVNFRVTP